MNENDQGAGKLFLMLMVLGFFIVPGALAADVGGNVSPEGLVPADTSSINMGTDYFAVFSEWQGQLYLFVLNLMRDDSPVYVIPVEQIYVDANSTNVTDPVTVVAGNNSTNSTFVGGGGVASEEIEVVEKPPEVPVAMAAVADEVAMNETTVADNKTTLNATDADDILLEIESVPAVEPEPVMTAEEQAAYDAMMDEINRKEVASEASEPEDDPVTRIEQVESATGTHAEAIEEAEREVTSSSPVTYVTENNITRAEIGNGGGVTTDRAARDAQTMAASLGAKIEVESESGEPNAGNSTGQAKTTASTIVASQTGKMSSQSDHQPVCLGSCGKGVSSRTQAGAATNIALVSSAFT